MAISQGTQHLSKSTGVSFGLGAQTSENYLFICKSARTNLGDQALCLNKCAKTSGHYPTRFGVTQWREECGAVKRNRRRARGPEPTLGESSCPIPSLKLSHPR